jgi:hypothetical protein
MEELPPLPVWEDSQPNPLTDLGEHFGSFAPPHIMGLVQNRETFRPVPGSENIIVRTPKKKRSKNMKKTQKKYKDAARLVRQMRGGKRKTKRRKGRKGKRTKRKIK